MHGRWYSTVGGCMDLVLETKVIFLCTKCVHVCCKVFSYDVLLSLPLSFTLEINASYSGRGLIGALGTSPFSPSFSLILSLSFLLFSSSISLAFSPLLHLCTSISFIFIYSSSTSSSSSSSFLRYKSGGERKCCVSRKPSLLSGLRQKQNWRFWRISELQCNRHSNHRTRYCLCRGTYNLPFWICFSLGFLVIGGTYTTFNL